MKKNDITIKKNVEIALANSGDHLGAIDVGAIAVLLRLSELLDYCFDAGDLANVPQLLQRHLALMDALKLTPKSRAVTGQVSKETKDYGKEITERYLRLIPSASAKQTSSGAKSGNSGGGTGRKPRGSADGVAKTRPKSGSSN